VPILVSSLLLNFIATGFVSYMINFPMLEVGGARSQTAMIAEASRLPRLAASGTLHSGLFLIAAVFVAVTFVLRRTVSGYELRMFGANRDFAVAGGINPARLTLVTMFASGAIAGLVGAIQVLGFHYRLIQGALTGPGFAWTGVMAAILAGNDPVGVVVSSLFFAAVDTGASGMERATNVPFELSFILQAIIILLVASRAAFRRASRRDDL
jgi:simple sugar transport system permease protein